VPSVTSTYALPSLTQFHASSKNALPLSGWRAKKYALYREGERKEGREGGREGGREARREF
jgi:hypothetical protein